MAVPFSGIAGQEQVVPVFKYIFEAEEATIQTSADLSLTMYAVLTSTITENSTTTEDAADMFGNAGNSTDLLLAPKDQKDGLYRRRAHDLVPERFGECRLARSVCVHGQCRERSEYRKAAACTLLRLVSTKNDDNNCAQIAGNDAGITTDGRCNVARGTHRFGTTRTGFSSAVGGFAKESNDLPIITLSVKPTIQSANLETTPARAEDPAAEVYAINPEELALAGPIQSKEYFNDATVACSYLNGKTTLTSIAFRDSMQALKDPEGKYRVLKINLEYAYHRHDFPKMTHTADTLYTMPDSEQFEITLTHLNVGAYIEGASSSSLVVPKEGGTGDIAAFTLVKPLSMDTRLPMSSFKYALLTPDQSKTVDMLPLSKREWTSDRKISYDSKDAVAFRTIVRHKRPEGERPNRL